MVSFIIKSNNILLIEITGTFDERDLKSISLFLESLIEDYLYTTVYLKIENNIKKQVRLKLKNNWFLKPYQIRYLPRENHKIAS